MFVDKPLPFNKEAEDAVIGACLSNNEMALITAMDNIESNDFQQTSHCVIWDGITELYKDGKPIDVVSVSNYLEGKGKLKSVGGSAELSHLSDKIPSSSSVEYYAKIVKNHSIRRKLIKHGIEIIESAYNNPESSDTISLAEKELFQIEERSYANAYKSPKQSVIDAMHDIEKRHSHNGIIGLPTYLRDFDNQFGGLHKGRLYVLAGRPAMGKSITAENIAHNQAKNNHGIMYFSIEMPENEIQFRRFAMETKVSYNNIVNGSLSDKYGELKKIVDASGFFMTQKFIIDDTPGIRFTELLSKCRRAVRIDKVEAIYIDHMGLIENYIKGGTEEAQLAQISKQLKALAKELDIPIVLVVQLNRDVEKREDKRPKTADLRGSGRIEQDADMIVMCYRDEYYNKENTDKKDILELIPTKNRHGGLFTVEAMFYGSIMKIDDVTYGVQKTSEEVLNGTV